MSDTFLRDLSVFAEQRIAADPFFAAMPKFAERKGLISSEISVALTTITQIDDKCGIGVIVRQPVVDRNDSETPNPHLRVLMEIDVVELPEFNFGINGSGIASGEVWTNLLRLFAGWRIEPLSQTLTPAEVPMQFEEREGELVTTLRLQCFYPARHVDKCAISRLVTVESLGGGNWRCKSTTPTSGASLYFAAVPLGDDPVLPGPDNATATASDAWFTFSSSESFNLYAVAHATGKLASDVSFNQVIVGA